MSDHKFKAYLLSRQWNDAQSKFVDHALTDVTFPDPGSWEHLLEHLKGKGADEYVIEEAEYIWSLYVSSTRGQAG